MGNSPSVPDKKDAHRLSKAKGLQTTTGPPSPPIVPPGQLGDPELSVVPQRPTLDLLQLSPSQIRLQNASFVTAIEQHPPREQNEEAMEYKSGGSRESSSGLLSKSPPEESPLNLPFDPKEIDLKTAVAILEELRKTASPEDLVALHRALLPRTGESSAAGESGAAAVIRPRSLATPGVATRRTSRSAQVEGHPSKPWKQEMLGSSPLSKLEELGETIASKGIDMPPRAVTPTSLEYSHTGTYRIGSLVVTNGAPVSPGPSVIEPKTLRASIDSKREEEYFTADEAEKLKAAKLGKRKASTKLRGKEATAEDQRSKTIPPADRRKSAPLPGGSSLKPELSDSVISGTITTLPTSLSTSPHRSSWMPGRQPLHAVTVAELLKDPPHITGSLSPPRTEPPKDPAHATASHPPPGIRRAKSNSSQAPCLVSEDEDGPISRPTVSQERSAGLIFGPMELDEGHEHAPVVKARKDERPQQSPDGDQVISPMATSHADLSDALLKSVPLPRAPLSMSDSGYSSSSTHGIESASDREFGSQRSSVSSPGAMKVSAKMLDSMDDRAGLVESPQDLHPGQLADMEIATGLGLSPVPSAVSSTVRGSPDPSLVDMSKKDRRSKTWRSSFIRLPLSRLRTSEIASSSEPEPETPAKAEKTEKAQKAEKSKKPAKEKAEKAPKVEKVKAEKPAKTDKQKPEKADKAKPENTAKPELAEKPEQTEKPANDAKVANKKLQKKRPASMMKVMSFDASLKDAIPRIPPDVQQRLEERAEEPVGTTGVTGIQFVENQQAKTTLAIDGANVDLAINPLASAGYYNPEVPQSMQPASAPGVPSGPSTERGPAPRPSARRRLSLTRLSQNLKAKAASKEALRDQQQQQPAYHSDEDIEERHYLREFTSIPSVSQSLGSSAYELGARAQRPHNSGNGNGPAPPGAPGQGQQQKMTFLPWNGPPGVPYVRAARVERPSLFHGRHRPKSFNGHGRATMEALGEVDEAGDGGGQSGAENERRVELPAPSGGPEAMVVAVMVPAAAAPSSPVELEAPSAAREGAQAVPPPAGAPTAAQNAAASMGRAEPKTPVPELPATPVVLPAIAVVGPSPEAPAAFKGCADAPQPPPLRPGKLRRPQVQPAASYPPSAPRRSVSTTAVPASAAAAAPADWAAARETWSTRRAHATAAAPDDIVAAVTAAAVAAKGGNSSRSSSSNSSKKRDRQKAKALRPSRSASLRARLGLRASRSQPELRVAPPNWVIDEAYDDDEYEGQAGGLGAVAERPRELYQRSLETPIAAVPAVPAGAWERARLAAATSPVPAVPAAVVSPATDDDAVAAVPSIGVPSIVVPSIGAPVGGEVVAVPVAVA